jgi:hypothetical protein
MVTEQDIEQILATGKRSQGPLIDRAIDTLLANGRQKKEAFAELGAALGRNPATIGQGYYRRQAEKNGPARARVSSVVPTPHPTPHVVRAMSTSAHGDGAVQVARDAMLNAIAAYAEAVANERLTEIRRVLGS